MKQYLPGAAAACQMLDRIPDALSSVLKSGVTSVEPIRTSASQEQPDRFPVRAHTYLRTPPEVEQLPVRAIVDAASRLGAHYLGAFAATLDRRQATLVQMSVRTHADSWRQGYQREISKIETSIVRDAYISLSKQNNIALAVGWYLVMFALRDKSDAVLAPVIKHAPREVAVQSFLSSARTSSRAQASSLFFEQLQVLLHAND